MANSLFRGIRGMSRVFSPSNLGEIAQQCVIVHSSENVGQTLVCRHCGQTKVCPTFSLFQGVVRDMNDSFPSVTQGANKEDRGQKLYVQYCASCHGVDGKGGGPVAPSLKTFIPDLTTIEKRNGKFDQLRVQHIISGDVEVVAHGQKEMPVWGYIFRQKAGGQSTSTLTVYALASYIKSIQQK